MLKLVRPAAVPDFLFAVLSWLIQTHHHHALPQTGISRLTSVLFNR